MRESTVCDSARPICPKCGLKLHGLRVDVGSTWGRCEKCRQAVYLLGTLGGVTLAWAVTPNEMHKLSTVGMLPRDVLYALNVIGSERAQGVT